MASVSSSDGGYNQYMRSVGELEEEYNLAIPSVSGT